MTGDSDEYNEADAEGDAEGNLSTPNDVSLVPNDAADPAVIVEAKIPPDIRDKYEIISYRNAAVILAEAHAAEFAEILDALRKFTISTAMIRTAGGNESQIPKLFSQLLRPLAWHETIISADLSVTLAWREEVRKTLSGRSVMGARTREIKREKYLDGHKIDYVKGKVAFDLEWNSKDQTFDRDLYAMNAFFLSGAIDVGVLVTRSLSMNDVFRGVGPALTRSGEVERLRDGRDRPTIQKYGASTTWMGKLLYRLNAGRNGGCPILAVGITPAAVNDWAEPSDTTQQR